MLAAVVYLSTWVSWFATTGGYDRDWGANHPEARTTRLLGTPLASLLHYQRDIWNFHTGDFINHAQHAYAPTRSAGW